MKRNPPVVTALAVVTLALAGCGSSNSVSVEDDAPSTPEVRIASVQYEGRPLH